MDGARDSAEPCGRSRPASGFTLIEVLVVLAIAATLTTLVILRLGAWQDPQDPQRLLERIAARIGHQCEQALFQSRPRGLRFSPSTVDAWQGGPEGWQALADRGADAALSIPPSTAVMLELGGYPVDLAAVEPEPEGSASPAIAPQVVCQPLGELTPFRLILTSADGQDWVLEGEASGRLILPEEAR
jgi:type II secretion system protein H